MEHTLSKTILISMLIELISLEYKISLDESRDLVYTLPIIELIEDDETGLYGESPLYVFSIFEKEYQEYKKNLN